MSKSPIDQPRDAGSGRVQNYLQQDRESGIHPAIQSLHRQPHARDEETNRRAAEFARIERGHSV